MRKNSAYRSFAERLLHDLELGTRRCNREGSYALTPLRDALEHELEKLFAAQRRFANPATDHRFEERYRQLAFSQRPGSSREPLIGRYPFLPDQKRAPKQASSFERFRFLQKLVTPRLRLVDGCQIRPLNASERAMSAKAERREEKSNKPESGAVKNARKFARNFAIVFALSRMTNNFCALSFVRSRMAAVLHLPRLRSVHFDCGFARHRQ